MARLPAMNDVQQRWCVGEKMFSNYAEALAFAKARRQEDFSLELADWLSAAYAQNAYDWQSIARALMLDFDIKPRKPDAKK